MNSTTDAAWLLDVNALIALLSPMHTHHAAMRLWFSKHSHEGWATCPLTENGAIRIISQPSFNAGPYIPTEATGALRYLCTFLSETHYFWPDDISLTDDLIFRMEHIRGPKLVTDAYLLGLAAKHNARVVSFDRTLPWQAIRNGTSKLIESPLLQ